ncbi:predicted protein [Plenodomus lingam JN3]|uniref:Predicted protein n=1 Tax=Leptosphaeria maculans (strain JN3 / isolate v23.1.3 / race Av1-4-5-6-7-8) TaxID=985895 RepID=E4ZZJ1_LEPMJ|nr:predicted protein [Plenodomus lingam JN3]CBX97107.1 predicted protein [Plenodomus lingam JN3]
MTSAVVCVLGSVERPSPRYSEESPANGSQPLMTFGVWDGQATESWSSEQTVSAGWTPMRRARRESLMNCLLHEEASLNSHHGKPAAKKRKAQVVHLITPNRLKQGRVLTIVHQGPCQTRGIVDQVSQRRNSRMLSPNGLFKCFYHPNPMTKPAGTPRKKPEPRRRKANSEARSAQHHGRLSSLTLSPPTLRNDVNTGPITNTWPTPPESASRANQLPSDPTRSFYLGSTSYAAVFTENRGALPDTVHEQPSERLSVTPSTSSQTIGSRHCQFGIGASIVSTLNPFDFFEKSVKMYFDTNKASALIGPLILSILPQLRQDLEHLGTPGPDSHLLYAAMTKNTARPLKVPSTMLPSAFHTLITGKNLRWETLGLILAVAGSNAQFTSPHDPLFTLPDGAWRC